MTEAYKASVKLSTEDTPQKITSTTIELIKTQKYNICKILYNLYEDDIFQNKTEIKFFSITAPPFIKYTEKFGHCMELIDAAVKPYHITTLKKQLDKADLIFLSCH